MVGERERTRALSVSEAATDVSVRVLLTFTGLVHGDGDGRPVVMTRGLVGEVERERALPVSEAATDARVRVFLTFAGLVRGDCEDNPVVKTALWPTSTEMGVDCFTLVSSIFTSNLVKGCQRSHGITMCTTHPA